MDREPVGLTAPIPTTRRRFPALRGLGGPLAGAAMLAVCACAPTTPGLSPAAATAPAPLPVAARQCFNPGLVNGFQVVDERAVDLNVGARQVFRVEVLGTCADIRQAVGVGVRARGSGYVCDGMDLDLIVPGPFGRQSCPARSIRLRTPEELEAERSARF